MRPDGSVWLRSPRLGFETCWGLLVFGVAPLTPRLRPFSSDRNIPTRALKPLPKTPIPYRMSLSLKVASLYPQVSEPATLAATGAVTLELNAETGAADARTLTSIAAVARNARGRPPDLLIEFTSCNPDSRARVCITRLLLGRQRSTRGASRVHPQVWGSERPCPVLST